MIKGIEMGATIEIIAAIAVGFLPGMMIGFLFGIRLAIWLVEQEEKGGIEAIRGAARWREIRRMERGKETAIKAGRTGIEIEGDDLMPAPGEME